MAWSAVFSFVAAFCFALTFSDEGRTETADGAMFRSQMGSDKNFYEEK
jgi:hypothetical protein